MVAVQSNTVGADNEFERLLGQYPALAKAHEVARSCRSAQYFQMTTHLFDRWVQPLAVEWMPEAIFLNNLMVSIDKLFEACQTQDEVQLVADELSRMTRLNSAMLYLLTLPEDSEMTLEEAVKIHLAFVTAAGHKHLQIFHNDETANSWLKVWQRLVSSHNNQQREFSIETLEPDDYKPGSDESFSRTVQSYLSRYEKTGGLAMAIIGTAPFSHFASPNLFAALAELSEQLEPLFRLVQDICLDTSEVLNLGIFVVAAERKISIIEARTYLQENRTRVAVLEDRLREEEQAYVTKARETVSTIIAKFPDASINKALTDFSQVLMGVAKKLSDDCKSFRQIEP